ncbi:ribosomal L7Ae/L30e/S12e/Gadd45 family protein [Herbivorax sp. ANBcel31]|uniref:ribosomal L7Ae/L30e/S12e/Gadd45 family protein n=1 Tax=Herbivorax sp. ANBcel31 TaxID=3069754 RepID=UPI0027B78AA7|nr:ribosomal L7Ae/L30e/S12e/Gadd45 family protein [Herbivorax sp. ANBcel31]MDQ2086685.1 ribosomal L7Ae/L30e/S12e/Gadd45 family protein [Herbivorax sp. ANBcel31]
MEDFKDINKIVGLKQSLKAVQKGIVGEVYIAKDAEERVVSKIVDLCTEKDIPIVYADSMKQLGKACGIDVSAAVVSILK